MKKQKAFEALNIIYEDNKDWLKFGETKNAALLAFNGVLIFGYIRIILSESNLIPNGFLLLALGIIFISVINLLISFLPSIHKSKNLGSKKCSPDTNLRFYKEIFNLSPESYLQCIYTKYFDTDNEEYDLLELEVSYQIIAISAITMDKYRAFKRSIIITLTSIALPLIGWILHIGYYHFCS